MSKLLPDVQKLDQKIAVDTGSPNIEVPNEAVTYDSGWKSNKYMSGPAFNTKFNGGKEDFSAELREFSKVVSALLSRLLYIDDRNTNLNKSNFRTIVLILGTIVGTCPRGRRKAGSYAVYF